MVSDWWKRLFADVRPAEANRAPMPAMHNQRVASGRIIHIWYQIAFASSPLIFSSILGLARGEKGSFAFADLGMMVFAVVAGVAPLFFPPSYVLVYIDRTIRSYYPRLLALEVMLGFQFWRETLKALQGDENDSRGSALGVERGQVIWPTDYP